MGKPITKNAIVINVPPEEVTEDCSVFRVYGKEFSQRRSLLEIPTTGMNLSEVWDKEEKVNFHVQLWRHWVSWVFKKVKIFIFNESDHVFLVKRELGMSDFQKGEFVCQGLRKVSMSSLQQKRNSMPNAE